MAFWPAFAMLLVVVGLLGTPVVSVAGAALLLVTLAVWMAGPWTSPGDILPPGRRFGFVGLGMLAFIGSETVFFASLIVADVHLSWGGHHETGDPAQHLDAAFPAINTVVLLLSGVTAHFAQVREIATRQQAALSHLRPADRALLVARIDMGYDYKQLARFFGKPTPNAARVAVHRALQRAIEAAAKPPIPPSR